MLVWTGHKPMFILVAPLHIKNIKLYFNNDIECFKILLSIEEWNQTLFLRVKIQIQENVFNDVTIDCNCFNTKQSCT